MQCPTCNADRSALSLDARCGCGERPPCPPVDQWPRELKRWVQERLVLAALTPHGGDCDYAWRHVLAVLFRGVTVHVPDGTVQQFSFAATPDEVFAAALAIARESARTRAPKPHAPPAPTDPRRA